MQEPVGGSAPRLSAGRRIGFGIADFGFNLYYTGLNLFLLYYYTDILGIRPAMAGLIFALPLFWDAVTDPVMGVIASRTRTRMGRFRPYVLFGIVPLAISFVMMFAAPLIFPGAVIASAAIAHIIFRTCYTIVSIPYSALMATMTRSSSERGALAGVRMIFATLGGLFTVFMTLPLAQMLGGGDLATGFFWVGIVYGTLASFLFLVTFFATQEAPETMVHKPLSLAATFRVMGSNTALWILVAAIVAGAAGGAIFGKALIYYVKYVATIDLSITVALTSLTAAVSASVPIWMLISRSVDKRTAWLGGAAIALTAQAVLYFAPPANVSSFILLLVMMGFGNAAFYVTFWSMLPDTVEFGEWKSGVRDEGMVFGLNQLALKAASGLGIGILGFMLEAVGYVANQEQTDTTVAGLRSISILIPMMCGLLSAGFILFYPISKTMHGRLVRAIDYRTRKGVQA